MIGASVTVKGRFLTNPEGVRRDLMTAEEKGVARLTLLAHSSIKRSMSSPERRDPFWGLLPGTGDRLAVRSGTTRDTLSPGGVVVRLGNKVTSAVGSPLAHVKFLEEGGVKPGWSRIPTANAQFPNGLDRYAGKSIRNIPGAHLYRNPISRVLWAYRVGAGGLGSKSHELLYMLVRNLKIRGRHLFKNAAAVVRDKAISIVGQEIAIAVEKANN